MNPRNRTSKVASTLLTLTAVLGLAAGTSGCFVSTEPTDAYVDDATPVETTPAPAPAIAQVSVDAGATMSSTPGQGVGLYVEYAEGGHWNVFTTCDTAVSGASCNFDVVVSADPDVTLSNPQGQDLESDDRLSLETDGSIHLVTDTSFGSDGVTFDADPGAVIEIDVLLDGVAQPQFVYAVSGGTVREGVPTNPVDFMPASF